MRSIINILFLLGCISVFGGFAKIPEGYSGVKVNQFGRDKGGSNGISIVNGWVFYNPFSYDIFKFPKFMQTVVWDDDISEDKSFMIQTKDGAYVRLNVELSYQLDEERAPLLFEKLRKNHKEIESGYLKDKVWNYFLEEALGYSVESFVENKYDFLKSVENKAREGLAKDGVLVDSLSIIGVPVLPETIIKSIESKILHKQKQEKEELYLQSVKYENDKNIEEARIIAELKILEASANAKVNKILYDSIAQSLIDFDRVKN